MRLGGTKTARIMDKSTVDTTFPLSLELHRKLELMAIRIISMSHQLMEIRLPVRSVSAAVLAPRI